MKKIFSIAALALACTVSLTSCNKDDDSSDSNNNNDCITCTISQLGITSSTEFCDNGDGSITVTVNGQSTVVENTTISQASQALVTAGASCN